jgi:hypothetical protein
LHALPPSTGAQGEVVVPSTPGAGSGTLGVPGGRREWRPRGDAGDPITGKLKEEKEERFPLKKLGGGEYAYEGPSFSAHIAADGQVSFDNKTFRDFKGLSGGYDLTDMIMRGRGEDPYRHEKKMFLQATEEMRTKMAQTALKERLEQSLAGLSVHLETIWQLGRSARERRQLIYAIWKEAATAGDAELVAAGEKARGIVEQFIRRRLVRALSLTWSPPSAPSRISKVCFQQRRAFG